MARVANRHGPGWVPLAALVLAGCETAPLRRPDPRRAAMEAAILAEPPGNYFVGRRLYKKDYKMWGWVREPGQPWKTAQLVMLNEQRKLAPDRERGTLGDDNNFEYTLRGGYSGEMVYEPASNRFFPEFVLTGYELRATDPPMIFSDPRVIDPAIRLLTPPD